MKVTMKHCSHEVDPKKIKILQPPYGSDLGEHDIALIVCPQDTGTKKKENLCHQLQGYFHLKSNM